MIIIEGPAGNRIGEDIARILKVSLIRIEPRFFPDGESRIKIPDLPEHSDVVIVQSTYFPQDKHMMELFFIADALKERGVESITAVVPYLAYARQNRKFEEEDIVSIGTALKLVSEAGVSTLITVEPHKSEALSFFKGKTIIVDASEAFYREISKQVKKPFILSPDNGGIERAKKIASMLGCKYGFIEKERDLKTGMIKAGGSVREDLAGKDIVIVDDIISSGGTIENASRLAASKGARSIIAVAVHLVMVGDAYERMANAGVSEVYGTNTIPYEKAKLIDLSGYIAGTIRNARK